jgi:hypothetical protein
MAATSFGGIKSAFEPFILLLEKEYPKDPVLADLVKTRFAAHCIVFGNQF